MNDIPRNVIKSWLYEDVIISRLRITKHYNIVLPDYNNMEVKMTPLEKTIYLFFLKNPIKGYSFKELYEHKDEIKRIYSKLARTSNLDEIEKSVDELVNPYGRSISEKCARIKAKFILLMPIEIAQNYYIYGKQGDLKSITLDRSMVEWEINI